ncbi:MAG TPA: class I SAM-dependent methyltransferase [Caulobacteraceae bacterium]|jgi:SAM-dependent methyltransferase|nr:class I SAM-dependent methyltransferase [Caulobacteraceae bacterium]
MICRSCHAELGEPILDLGDSPISNAYRLIGDPAPDDLYPLKLLVCPSCFLAQAQDVVPRERHFHEDYAYRSSASSSWREHVETYAGRMIGEFGLAPGHTMVEVGSNDGALSGAFAAAGVRAIGIDPAARAAEAAAARGVETVVGFFGADLAEKLAGEGVVADLMAANNVLAHVPDLNDFVAGFARLLAPEGLATFEFPLASELLAQGQYDTIYHEHYSYLSLTALRPLFARHGLEMTDVERLPTHGGSVRLFVRRQGVAEASPAVAALEAEERAQGLADLAGYRGFAAKVGAHRTALRAFLGGLKAEGLSIAGYAAPAKATTLLNYCGVGAETLDYVVDNAPTKQGRRIPGVGVPIVAHEHMIASPPDVVLILAWNIVGEIARDLEPLVERGVRLATPMPTPGFLP